MGRAQRPIAQSCAAVHHPSITLPGKPRAAWSSVLDVKRINDQVSVSPQISPDDIPAIKAAGFNPGEDIALCLDPASSEFFHDGKYVYSGEGKTRSIEEQAQYLAKLAGDYPIISIEDGMAEDDWEGWKIVTDLIGKKCQLVGDDIFVTNVEQLSKGIAAGIGNSILIKVNQIGTLSETLAAVGMAQSVSFSRAA